MKRNTYIGNPSRWCQFGEINFADQAQNAIRCPGEHTFCDINGNSLKLSDVTKGWSMLVKIKAKNVHWNGYEYLSASDDQEGIFCYTEHKVLSINFPTNNTH